MKRKSWTRLAVIVGLGLCVIASLLFGDYARAAPAAPAKIKWVGQSQYTGSDSERQFFEWAKWAEAVSGGLLEIKIHPIGGVVPPTEVFDAVSKGVLDLAYSYGGYSTGKIPEGNVETGLPFTWMSVEDAYDAFYEYGLADIIRPHYAKFNIHWEPYIVNYKHYFLGTTFPIYKLDDLKGKKMRAVGFYGDWVAAAGGRPTVITAGEQYMATKLGTIDGSWYAYIGGYEIKMHEVWKYYVWEPTGNIIVANMMWNQDSLKKLPDGVRKTLVRDTPRMLAAWSVWLGAAEEKLIAKAAKDSKVERVIWSPEDARRARELAVPIWDKAAKLSPDCAKMVEIIKKQQKDYGRM